MSLSIEGIRFLAFPDEEVDTVSMTPDSLFDLSLIALLAAFGLAFFAGFIKGAVGFALPMIMLAGLGSIMEPAAAVAGLVLPALVANLWQALRQGVFAAWQSVLEHWRFLVVMLIFIAISAQFLAHISDGVLFLILPLCTATLRAEDVPNPIEALRTASTTVKHVLPEAKKATIAIRSFTGLGSGVIVSPDGLVLTAGHISETPGRAITAILEDGTEVEGKTLGVSWLVDSGMIRLKKRQEPYPHVDVAPPGSYDDGEWCFALGHPDGYQEERGQVLRIGKILSRRNYVIRTDCRLLGGDSGGPLFDLQGRVIGIHSRIGFGGDENFHAPMDAYHADWDWLLAGDVKRFWPREERGFLGVQTEPVDRGVRVNGVVAESAADSASIQVGDVIVAVNRQVITDPRDFRLAVGANKAHDVIALTVKRGEHDLDIEIKLGPWPDADRLNIRSGDPEESDDDGEDEAEPEEGGEEESE